MSLVVELVPHLDAGDRTRWSGHQDERPLSELGRRQADALLPLLTAFPVDALYSSPALRCRQTIEPLAARFGLPITVLPDLHETDGFQPPAQWRTELIDPIASLLGGAYAAGRALAALRRMQTDHPQGRVAACSHGDMVPATAALLVGAYGITTPPPLVRRGGWYTIRLDGDQTVIETHQPPSGFPL